MPRWTNSIVSVTDWRYPTAALGACVEEKAIMPIQDYPPNHIHHPHDPDPHGEMDAAGYPPAADIRNQPCVEIVTEMSIEDAKRKYPATPLFNPNFTEEQRRIIESPDRWAFVLASHPNGYAWEKDFPTASEITRRQEQQLHLGQVFALAVHVHGDQRDKSGQPYLFHVMRVAMSMGNDVEIATALLHDVIEDAPLDETIAIARRIYALCGETVGDACLALTHTRDVPYMQYVRGLSINPLARTVKLADLRENMNEQRLRLLPSADADRLRKKYREAWDFLMGMTAPVTQPTKE